MFSTIIGSASESHGTDLPTKAQDAAEVEGVSETQGKGWAPFK